MTTQKYSLRLLLLESTTHIKHHPLIQTLAQSVTHIEFPQNWSVICTQAHQGDCIVRLHLVHDPTDFDGIFVDLIEAVNATTLEPDPACLQKGYATQMLTLLTQAADKTRTPLKLTAAPTLDEFAQQVLETPTAEELLRIYSGYGFKSVGKNSWGELTMERPVTHT